MYNRNMTVGEAAKAEGLTSYDTALPQGWVDEARGRGFDVRGHFVWCYDEDKVVSPNVYGYPHPITMEGRVIAGFLAAHI